MKMKNLTINPKTIRICLYVLGAILLVYYIYLLYGSCLYIGDLIKVKEITLADDFGKVIEYIMTKTFSYLFYSISIFSFGALISICDKRNQREVIQSEEK